MKLLFDENLSTELVESVQDIFPGSAHVTNIAGTAITDERLWQVARDEGYMIVLKRHRQMLHIETALPKVVWLSFGRATASEVAALLRERHSEIQAFHDQTIANVLSI